MTTKKATKKATKKTASSAAFKELPKRTKKTAKPVQKPVSQTVETSQNDKAFGWKAAFFVVLIIAILQAAYIITAPSAQVGENAVANALGNSGSAAQLEGAVVIEEYSSFGCGFCKRAAPTVKQIKDTYGDDIVFEYKHFPLDPASQQAAEASECARDQGQFWEYHDLLFERQGQFSDSQLKQYAVDLGLDTATFNSCLDNGEKEGVVSAHQEEGRLKGVRGTPTFFIGNEQLVGAQPFSAFQSLIESSGANPTQTAPASEDPEVDFIVVEDSSCTSCSTDQIVEAVTSQILPTAQLERVEFDSARGQELLAEFDINALPTFIFSKNLDETSAYSQLSQIVDLKGSNYVIQNRAAGNVKFLELPDTGSSASVGDSNAPVTIIEFSDFECPFCARFYNDAYQDIQEQYVANGQVQFVFKHLPLSFHANAQKAAEASECARDQGQFWEYHDLLFENQQSLTVTDLKGYAADLGLDTQAFNNCLDSDVKESLVQADAALAAEFGITGTPGFIVNGIVVSGAQPFSVFQDIVEAELGN